MIYEIEMTEEAKKDLQSILNILLLNYNNQKMQKIKCDV